MTLEFSALRCGKSLLVARKMCPSLTDLGRLQVPCGKCTISLVCTMAVGTWAKPRALGLGHSMSLGDSTSLQPDLR